MGRDKKNKPKKLNKIKDDREKRARRELEENQRQEEIDDDIQRLLRFLDSSAEGKHSEEYVFEELFKKAVKIMKKNPGIQKIRRDALTPAPPQDQPESSGIDYEQETRDRRLQTVESEVFGDLARTKACCSQQLGNLDVQSDPPPCQEVDQDQPGPSGIDYESERRKRRSHLSQRSELHSEDVKDEEDEESQKSSSSKSEQ